MTILYLHYLSKSKSDPKTDFEKLIVLLFLAFFMALDWRISGWFL